MRTIDWKNERIVLIDQTLLPGTFKVVDIDTVDELIDAIKRLAVRGAPALGVAGALGVALAARNGDDVPAAADKLSKARPTAVNLSWGVNQVLAKLDQGTDAMVETAKHILEGDVRRHSDLGRRGAQWLVDNVGPRINVHTHCNAGALACVEWGTALGVVRALQERDALGHVYLDETRPLLQGARLTAWELRQMGVEHTVVVDSAGATVLARGLVQAVLVGADRIAANGDVVNKIGTYPLALAAARANVPFLVAAPESTVDMATPDGASVEIEIRDAAEVLGDHTPDGSAALNFAFDVTPADLVTAIITDERIIDAKPLG
ncbi:S-methyl-5-thioribose-1-phosphate isomerase [Kibdelosporangium phytohabitans]|uniref:Methylthioribose-1-phosphate isomerase n=1 Tax=Kibdelosporangium phytohabitans TaxID=860235 RepID=A0A0N9IGB2_9PSEU|nr:S-methyl-5-thioribose-1-phosphate isomerase [Kibdelosporangium phytohabitans]ALG15534.1 initiation factor 2B subunit alpha [Kibdelosporangium phytohabitans]MBE1464677.1 methylthioribose-1-phosphate isomerase [Kibdelosporangium phytohabitans]